MAGLTDAAARHTEARAPRSDAGAAQSFTFFFAVFFVAALASQLLSGAYRSDLSQTGDEAAHFVTALMMHDYLRWHLGGNFLRFAKDYYAHFPRVGLGHWPPMFELTQATAFFLSRSEAAAIAFQAVVAGMFAGLPATVVSMRHGRLAGFAAGLALFLAPVPLFLANTVMADNFLGVLVFVSAWSWQKVFDTRSLKWCLIFSVIAAAAILTKGSAIALGLVPFLHAWAKRDTSLLLDRRVLLCGAAVAVVTAPWYFLTYKLAAAGFNYSWGLRFTTLALSRYSWMLVVGIGVPVSLGFVFGVWWAFSNRTETSDGDDAAFAAAAIAILVAAILIPADIAARYLVPAYPCMVVVAASGFSGAIKRVSRKFLLGERAQLLAFLALFGLGVLTTFSAPHIDPFGAQRIVDSIASSRSPNPLILVSGSPRFEGAVIATFALAEEKPVHYVVRASKVLAQGNFMGSDYQSRFSTPSAVRDWLMQNEIGFVASCIDREAGGYAHTELLMRTMTQYPAAFRQIARFRGSEGLVSVQRLAAAGSTPSPRDSVFAEIQLSPAH